MSKKHKYKAKGTEKIGELSIRELTKKIRKQHAPAERIITPAPKRKPKHKEKFEEER